ncbi:MAG: ORF6N domain-containing protein [Anaerolineales bacterium]|nr:ORF6N domain-containing protein [Anaerolineales bacterium]
MTKAAIILSETIENRIIFLRGQKVILSFHLAEMYGVEPRALIQAVQRNRGRFPPDFMIQLSADEWGSLRSHFVSLEIGRGKYPKYLPYAFTEQGVAMLSSVLNSPRAVQVNIEIAG